jgi:hypothetical protein
MRIVHNRSMQQTTSSFWLKSTYVPWESICYIVAIANTRQSTHFLHIDSTNQDLTPLHWLQRFEPKKKTHKGINIRGQSRGLWEKPRDIRAKRVVRMPLDMLKQSSGQNLWNGKTSQKGIENTTPLFGRFWESEWIEFDAMQIDRAEQTTSGLSAQSFWHLS